MPRNKNGQRLSFLLPKYPFRFLGATSASEIFAVNWGYNSNVLAYVYFYDMKQNSFRRVKIEGKCSRICYS